MAYAPALVTGATPVSLSYGLFSVVAPREGSADRWEGGGIEFEGLGCLPSSGGGEIGPLDCETGDAPGLPKEFEGGLTLSEASSFLVYEGYVCSPIGSPLGHAEEVARTRLEAREEWRVEAVLGERLEAEAEDQAAESSVKTAFAAAELVIATNLGSQGVIHVRRDIALLGLEAGVLETRGARLFTKLGTPVIAGSGYTFDKLIVTAQLFGYRSEIITQSNVQGDLLDREKNDLYAVAERHWLIAYEQCGPWGVPITAETSA